MNKEDSATGKNFSHQKQHWGYIYGRDLTEALQIKNYRELFFLSF